MCSSLLLLPPQKGDKVGGNLRGLGGIPLAGKKGWAGKRRRGKKKLHKSREEEEKRRKKLRKLIARGQNRPGRKAVHTLQQTTFARQKTCLVFSTRSAGRMQVALISSCCVCWLDRWGFALKWRRLVVVVAICDSILFPAEVYEKMNLAFQKET